MKLLFSLFTFLCCFLGIHAQENITPIDTTGLKYSDQLYFYDLTIEESENKNIVLLDWKEHRDVKYVVIELRDLRTKELFHQEKYYSSSAELPAAAQFTIYPVSYTKKGEAITTTLARFKSGKSKPLQPKSYQKVLEQQERIKKQNRLRKQQAIDGVFSFVDTTTYRYTNDLYFYDLTLKESSNENKVFLSWQKQSNVKFLMIELRNPVSHELYYRDKHYISPVELPADAEYTVYPVYYKQKGEAVTTTLAQFQSNGSIPLSPKSYDRAIERKERKEKARSRRAAAEKAYLQQKKLYDEKRANRITPKVIILVFVVLFLSILIVVGIWLFRRATKPKDPFSPTQNNPSNGWD